MTTEVEENDKNFSKNLKEMLDILNTEDIRSSISKLYKHLECYPDESHFERVVVALPSYKIYQLKLLVDCIKEKTEKMHVKVSHWHNRVNRELN